jgi:beta-glucanase (GH16 family)
MISRSLGILLALFLALAPASPGTPQDWSLVWSDEFDGPAGTPPDASKWNFDVGGNGWGNNELEYYTNRLDNSFIDGEGNLVIKALKENFTGTDGVRRNYTSARMLTAGKFVKRFGKFEARLKLPAGQGIWPAFWMLGEDISSVGWPRCGEMDIMENIGREPSTVHGTLHGPGAFGGNGLSGSFLLSGGQPFSSDFHVFTLEWQPNVVRFFVDGNLYQTRTPADLPAGAEWVFDHPFFLLLNVAVGGNWPGSPDDTTVFPQTMLVDYVRVYEDPALADLSLLITSAVISGKNIIVSGEGFQKGSTILLGGETRTAKFSSQTRLIGKKLAKSIPRGQTVTIQVRNPDGSLSNEVSLRR